MKFCPRAIPLIILLLCGQAMTAQNMGKLLILRNTGAQQSARTCLLQEGEQALGHLANRQAMMLELPAGPHTLQTRLKTGPVMGYSVHSQAGAYTFYELQLYKTRGILPSSGYRFRIVPLSPKRLFVLLRDEEWLRHDLGPDEYDILCKMLKVRPMMGQKN
jgi:hypothetical protein